MNVTSLTLRSLNIYVLSFFQSFIRGALVRKWMREVQLSFEDVVQHIEKNSDKGVDWRHDLVCKPKVKV